MLEKIDLDKKISKKEYDTFMEELQKIQQRNVPSYEPGKNGEETR